MGNSGRDCDVDVNRGAGVEGRFEGEEEIVEIEGVAVSGLLQGGSIYVNISRVSKISLLGVESLEEMRREVWGVLASASGEVIIEF